MQAMEKVNAGPVQAEGPPQPPQGTTVPFDTGGKTQAPNSSHHRAQTLVGFASMSKSASLMDYVSYGRHSRGVFPTHQAQIAFHHNGSA